VAAPAAARPVSSVERGEAGEPVVSQNHVEALRGEGALEVRQRVHLLQRAFDARAAQRQARERVVCRRVFEVQNIQGWARCCAVHKRAIIGCDTFWNKAGASVRGASA